MYACRAGRGTGTHTVKGGWSAAPACCRRPARPYARASTVRCQTSQCGSAAPRALATPTTAPMPAATTPRTTAYHARAGITAARARAAARRAAATRSIAARARAAAASAQQVIPRRVVTPRRDHAAGPVPQALRVTARACSIRRRRSGRCHLAPVRWPPRPSLPSPDRRRTPGSR